MYWLYTVFCQYLLYHYHITHHAHLVTEILLKILQYKKDYENQSLLKYFVSFHVFNLLFLYHNLERIILSKYLSSFCFCLFLF